MVMSQSYVKFPRSARMQATHIVMFPSKATEIERLYDEHGPPELNKNEFAELVQSAITPREGDEYPFLYVDTTKPSTEKFRRNMTSVLRIDGSEGAAAAEEKKDNGVRAKRKRKPSTEEEADDDDDQILGKQAGKKRVRR